VFRFVCAALAMMLPVLFAAAARPFPAAAQGVPVEPAVADVSSSASPLDSAAIAAGAVFTEVADAVSVAAGSEHSCLLTSSGAVKCWGRNQFGQLGNGTNASSRIPVQVAGLTSGVKKIALGSSHSCAITANSTVQCWGRNSDGQLGNGSVGNSPTPVTVALLTSVFMIAAGEAHTCALDVSGGQKFGEATCWGDNAYGQLGDGTTTDRLIPVSVADLQNTGRSMSAGARHTCLAQFVGSIYCWGNNAYRQLGDDTGLPAFKPRLLSGVSGQALTSGRLHTCARSLVGALVCWGRNSDGQLGNGANLDSAAPVAPSGLLTASVFAAGGAQSCAAQADGPLQCWGNNDDGQLGNGELTDSSVPVHVLWLHEGVAAVAVGGRHACARMTDSSVKCWGDNDYGQLGDGTQADASAPVQVQGYATGFAVISAGDNHTCGLRFGGGAACWGLNDKGQLGNGTFVDVNAPMAVTQLQPTLSALSSGGVHTCVTYRSGKLSGTRCWGSNQFGQLGAGAALSSPTPLTLSYIAALKLGAGKLHGCSVVYDGGRCWGRNDSGQLGDGTTDDSPTPSAVIGIISTTKMLAGGGGHTCAVTAADAVLCWGRNNFGQLGNNTTVSTTSPTPVSGFSSDALAVTAGDLHTCALSSAGAAFCWGMNFAGQLGNGENNGKATADAVTGIAVGATRIDAGASHTCAVVQGAVKCWGANLSGQLGNGTTASSNEPVAVIGMQAGVVDVTAGANHSCALTSAGTVRCWGWNGYGQLGSADNVNALQPVDVAAPTDWRKVYVPAAFRDVVE
jgi:alpha-tubulin suppressor-like RCC1 family protein